MPVSGRWTMYRCPSCGGIGGAGIECAEDCEDTTGAVEAAFEVVANPLDDPEAMARATEALQVSADMPHNERAAYIIRVALGGQ